MDVEIYYKKKKRREERGSQRVVPARAHLCSRSAVQRDSHGPRLSSIQRDTPQIEPAPPATSRLKHAHYFTYVALALLLQLFSVTLDFPTHCGTINCLKQSCFP